MNADHPPALFVPHGAPTFALEPGAAGAALGSLARRLPPARAILVISAHWETAVPTVGTATQLETLHDFGGFPDELYAIRYPATGCPEAALEVVAALEASGMPVRLDPTRGLDHGAWVPLRVMFPEADVPVVPLSIQPRDSTAGALRLGRALAPLRTRGFVVVASGNVTHNLRDYAIASRAGHDAPAYVRGFADWVWERLAARDIESLLDYRRLAPDAVRAHPSEEHLMPLYVALGAAGENFDAERVHAGIDSYVLAMDAYSFTAAATSH